MLENGRSSAPLHTKWTQSIVQGVPKTYWQCFLIAFFGLVQVSLLVAQTTTEQATRGQTSPEQASSTEEGNAKAFAREPKAIVFQNDSQWEDSRWQQTDVGPFLHGSFKTGRQPTLKGIAIRVGQRGQATVCFDTARMRVSAAWTGAFMKFGPRRFGLIDMPAAAGQLSYQTEQLAGWALDGRFQPDRNEITLPDVESGYVPEGSSETCLPKHWTHYRGMYTHGQRVVFSYQVGKVDVLESPWFVSDGDAEAFVRTMVVGASVEPLQLRAGGAQSRLKVLDDSGYASVVENGPVITIAPRNRTLRLKILVTSREVDDATVASLAKLAGPAEDLSSWIQQDPGRFAETLVTVGDVNHASDAYVIDTLTLPFENPWNALLFTSGHDFFSDGRGAICTAHGDVWTVSGIDQDLRQLRWRRFATGLSQPLGLKIVDDTIYVVGRTQVTRLHDRNGDGEADYYENFNNELFVSRRTHDYVTCLDTDPEGNFYFIHARTGVMRLSADGERLTSLADGFRNPNGMGVSPTGMVTAAPQQGQWTPESSLIVVKEGGYYGFGGPRITSQRPDGWDRPMCFIPRAMDNSGGAQVWVPDQRWGLPAGQMLHLSYGRCQILMALVEQVDGTFQGGTLRLPTTPTDFESGVMRGRFRPQDGQLYVTGLRGWQTRAIRDGCFQRVRYTGRDANLPVAVTTYANGVRLSFQQTLNPDVAGNPDNYFATQWNYVYSSVYGSPDFSVADPSQQGRDDVPILSATVMEDGRSVFLETSHLSVVDQLSIDYSLRSANGASFRGNYVHTINTNPNEIFPESQIVRRQRRPLVSREVLARLKRGVEFRWVSKATDQIDARTARLVAYQQPLGESATPFLPPGPFALTISGTLQTQLSGSYALRLVTNAATGLWINGDQVSLDDAGEFSATDTFDKYLDDPDLHVVETTRELRLRKGHNRIRIQYDSPPDGVARLRLFWKGYGFSWEPVPPDVLFHDSQSSELLVGQQRRDGRTLFARHQCGRCHQTGAGEQAMFESTLGAPDLSGLENRLNSQWVAQWLVSPSNLQSHPSMPEVFGDGEDTYQLAADIAAALAGASNIDSAASTSAELQRQGGDLFESLGCIACHHFDRPTASDQSTRRSLHFVAAKYRPKAIAEFLREPQRFDHATEMPDFRLTEQESSALASFVRQQARGQPSEAFPDGDAERGRRLIAEKACLQCHRLNGSQLKTPFRSFPKSVSGRGCLDGSSLPRGKSPAYALTNDQRRAIQSFLDTGPESLRRSVAAETSQRLVHQLRCVNCHDRDGIRSQRPRWVAEDGSGQLPEVIPSLTWAGEKFRSDWTERLLSGQLHYKSRPWIRSRMPAFSAYATPIAVGLAREHGVNLNETSARLTHQFDPEMANIGEKLTLETGLDCRQCHAIGDLQPRGDKQTQVALGINFVFIRDRMRRESYHRFMLDPPRFDPNTNMIKLSENGVTTKLRSVFDQDAYKQFDAVWHYIQSLPDPSP